MPDDHDNKNIIKNYNKIKKHKIAMKPMTIFSYLVCAHGQLGGDNKGPFLEEIRKGYSAFLL